jgi:hypothetical protein
VTAFAAFVAGFGLGVAASVYALGTTGTAFHLGITSAGLGLATLALALAGRSRGGRR